MDEFDFISPIGKRRCIALVFMRHFSATLPEAVTSGNRIKRLILSLKPFVYHKLDIDTPV